MAGKRPSLEVGSYHPESCGLSFHSIVFIFKFVKNRFETLPNPRVLLEVASLGGHRASYLELFSQMLEGTRTQSILQMIFARQPLFFITLEGSFGLYALVSPLRALLGRRTVGLLLRSGPAVHGKSLRLRIKRIVLKVLRRLQNVQTLAILPFSVEPRFAEIADGWIYDPQLWDLDGDARQKVTYGKGELAKDIRRVAKGRRVCVAIGRQDLGKGFDRFVDLYSKNPQLRQSMLFAYGGKVAESVIPLVDSFELAGGYSQNRFVTDEELLDLYAASDVVWCAYNPGYDQASGIFGRAVQLGLPVMVRRNSFVHRMCQNENLPHVDIDGDMNWDMTVGVPQKQAIKIATARADGMRGESMSRLLQALGLTS